MNAIQCGNCNKVVESKHRHDYQACPCGRVAVDGGDFYTRVVWTADDGPTYTVTGNDGGEADDQS